MLTPEQMESIEKLISNDEIRKAMNQDINFIFNDFVDENLRVAILRCNEILRMDFKHPIIGDKTTDYTKSDAEYMKSLATKTLHALWVMATAGAQIYHDPDKNPSVANSRWFIAVTMLILNSSVMEAHGQYMGFTETLNSYAITDKRDLDVVYANMTDEFAVVKSCHPLFANSFAKLYEFKTHSMEDLMRERNLMESLKKFSTLTSKTVMTDIDKKVEIINEITEELQNGGIKPETIRKLYNDELKHESEDDADKINAYVKDTIRIHDAIDKLVSIPGDFAHNDKLRMLEVINGSLFDLGLVANNLKAVGPNFDTDGYNEMFVSIRNLYKKIDLEIDPNGMPITPDTNKIIE